MKKLFVLRHGHSPTLGEAGVIRDSERPLSSKGKADVRQIAEAARSRGATPVFVLTSPLKRALETATQAAEVLHPQHGIHPFEPLSNVISGKELFDAIMADSIDHISLDQCEELLVVGHQPQLGDLIAYLTGKIIELRPGGFVAIEIGSPRSSLLWNENPK